MLTLVLGQGFLAFRRHGIERLSLAERLDVPDVFLVVLVWQNVHGLAAQGVGVLDALVLVGGWLGWLGLRVDLSDQAGWHTQ